MRLLPAFDPYTLSLQKEAEPLLPLRAAAVSRTAGWISQVRRRRRARWPATWTHEVKKGRLAIEVAPWRRLTKAERTAIDERGGEDRRLPGRAAGRDDRRAGLAAAMYRSYARATSASSSANSASSTAGR